MKKIIRLFSLLIVTTNSMAYSCEDYISDHWPNSRYTSETIDGGAVVTDNKTGLMWKQCSQGLTASDCESGAASEETWDQALEIAELESYAGFDDWRLPNKKELRTLVALNCINPSINEVIFPNTKSNTYWSSSIGANNIYDTWYINFFKGSDGNTTRDDAARIRLVR